MRRWHHQLTHLNIHKDWSRNVFRKNVKFQNVTTSLFLIRFSSFLHQSVGKFFTLSFEIMVILDWTSPLITLLLFPCHSVSLNWIWRTRCESALAPHIQKRRNFEANLACQLAIFYCYTDYTHGIRSDNTTVTSLIVRPVFSKGD